LKTPISHDLSPKIKRNFWLMMPFPRIMLDLGMAASSVHTELLRYHHNASYPHP